MKKEEAIYELQEDKRLYETEMCHAGDGSPDGRLLEAIDMAIEALQTDAVKRVDCSNFLLWLLDEIMDEENWELNAVANGEIIARKLKKLGLLEVKNGYYHRIFDENVWVVRCKDCKHGEKQKTYEEVKFYSCDFSETEEWFTEDFFCANGERREP